MIRTVYRSSEEQQAFVAETEAALRDEMSGTRQELVARAEAVQQSLDDSAERNSADARPRKKHLCFQSVDRLVGRVDYLTRTIACL